ncbi:protein trafficking Pga2 [Cladorrhinum sp. PSN259]|nr:protein trafficking Pga2 [Cladorrhinum sp. PSN259]
MEGLTNFFTVAGDRFTTNIQSTFENMSPHKWLRVVIVAGAYMLLRPYLIKLGGKFQMSTHEKEAAEAEAEERARAQGKITANQLRGAGGQRVELPDDTDDEDEEEDQGDSTSADWGKQARRRQRLMIKKLLQEEEKRLIETKEMEEDKDIEEFLWKE